MRCRLSYRDQWDGRAEREIARWLQGDLEADTDFHAQALYVRWVLDQVGPRKEYSRRASEFRVSGRACARRFAANDNTHGEEVRPSGPGQGPAVEEHLLCSRLVPRAVRVASRNQTRKVEASRHDRSSVLHSRDAIEAV